MKADVAESAAGSGLGKVASFCHNPLLLALSEYPDHHEAIYLGLGLSILRGIGGLCRGESSLER